MQVHKNNGSEDSHHTCAKNTTDKCGDQRKVLVTRSPAKTDFVYMGEEGKTLIEETNHRSQNSSEKIQLQQCSNQNERHITQAKVVGRRTRTGGDK